MACDLRRSDEEKEVKLKACKNSNYRIDVRKNVS